MEFSFKPPLVKAGTEIQISKDLPDLIELDISEIYNSGGESGEQHSFLSQKSSVSALDPLKQKKLVIRDGPHLQDTNHKEPDFQYPPTDQLDFENPIVGFVHKVGNWCGINIIMKNGKHSELPLKIQGGKGYTVSYIKPDSQIKKVVMKGDTEFGGVMLYDQKGTKVLEAGHTSTLYSKEFSLKDNERLIGIKSHLIGRFGSSISPRCEDLVFIIGSLQ